MITVAYKTLYSYGDDYIYMCMYSAMSVKLTLYVHGYIYILYCMYSVPYMDHIIVHVLSTVVQIRQQHSLASVQSSCITLHITCR